MFQDAMTDPRIKPLWEEVSDRLTVKEEVRNSKHWECAMSNPGVAVITTCPTGHPVESLAHELLHLKVQLHGYRRPRLIVWPMDTDSYGTRLLTMFDNEFQHHRMFPEFLALGLDQAWFYSDDDKDTLRYLKKVLRQKPDDFRQILCDYMTLVAPGGSLTDAQRDGLGMEFHRISNGQFKVKLDEVDHALAEWRRTAGFDIAPYARRFIHFFEDPAIAWIGYGKREEFPGNGFFVDAPFELESD